MEVRDRRALLPRPGDHAGDLKTDEASFRSGGVQMPRAPVLYGSESTHSSDPTRNCPDDETTRPVDGHMRAWKQSPPNLPCLAWR